MNSKKGSTSVFLCLILTSLIMLSFAMIWSAREHAVNSRADALINLAGESVMSCFHREILEGYGLFMLDSDSDTLLSRFSHYIRPSIDAMRDVRMEGVKISGARYSIVDPAPIREQIIDHMKSGGADLIAGNDKGPADSMGYHNLHHGPTAVSLPSSQLPEKDLWDILGKGDHLKDIGGIFTRGTEKFLLGSYVLGTFNDCTGIVSKDHFFHNEVEYILCGKLTDEENEKAITRSLITLRFPSNLAHIYSDGEKTAELTAAAEAIAPGPAGLLVQAALAGAWAYAESSNDAALLLEGHKVPLIKDPESWAMDIESLLSSLVSNAFSPEKIESLAGDEDDPEKLLVKNRSVIRPAKDSGLSYDQYLRILLSFKDDSVTVMRILDLIQINMRKDHDGSFLIGEQCTGISIEVRINERVFGYDKKY